MRGMISRGRILNREPWDFDWVEGYYVCLNGKEHRIYDGYAETDCGEYYPDYETVDPDTVGQYTGLTDKNGNRIFEGDIITHEKAKGVVRLGQYESKAGGNEIGFYIEWHDRVYSGWYRNDIGYWICDDENKAVVSGNIHDNPDLLEGMK